jgi:hypothetical protein
LGLGGGIAALAPWPILIAIGVAVAVAAASYFRHKNARLHEIDWVFVALFFGFALAVGPAGTAAGYLGGIGFAPRYALLGFPAGLLALGRVSARIAALHPKFAVGFLLVTDLILLASTSPAIDWTGPECQSFADTAARRLVPGDHVVVFERPVCRSGFENHPYDGPRPAEVLKAAPAGVAIALFDARLPDRPTLARHGLGFLRILEFRDDGALYYSPPGVSTLRESELLERFKSVIGTGEACGTYAVQPRPTKR